MSTLELVNLTIHRGSKCVCHDLSLMISPGECWGVLGQNAVGKTTLLQTLAGLYSHYAGNILLNAKDIRSLSRKHIARNLGLLLQQDEWHFPATVREFLMQGRYAWGSRWGNYAQQDLRMAEQILQKMELSNLADRAVNTLSGGEARRLSFATVLFQSPKILLLDEPVNHLDLRHQLALLQLVTQEVLEKQVSVMMVLHDINLAARFCNKILLVNSNGRIEAGDRKAILKPEILSKLYECEIVELGAGAQPYFFIDSEQNKRATIAQ